MQDAARHLERIRELAQSGRAEQARLALTRLLDQAPRDAALNAAMANVLATLRRPAQAAHFARRAVEARPDDAGLLTLLGGLLVESGSLAEAAATFAAAVDRNPGDLQTRYLELTPLMLMNRFGDAAARCRAALEQFPDDAKLAAKLAFCLRYLGRIEEAAQVLERALAGAPSSLGLTLDLAVTLNYAPGADPRRTFDLHVAAARMIRAAHALAPGEAGSPRQGSGPGPGPSDAERPLRVGLLSTDLRNHSVAFFAEPIIRGLDRAAFPLTCYFNGAPDEVTERLRRSAPAWRDVRTLRVEQLASLIRSDRIDILIELNGITTGDQLTLLLRRSAPVQITAIGYPNTTGLEEVDFRLVDSLTDPPGADAMCVERLMRLDPCFLCYRPPPDAPLPRNAGSGGGAVGAAPGGVVFGSFNALPKINGRVLALWARVLDAAPASRLIIKNRSLAEPSTRDDLAARFAAAGVDPARLTLLPPAPTVGEHLAAYRSVDVALDTFPYAGTTTTCEALLMGTPVVTLIGRTHAERVGLSLLTAAGAPEWCAGDEAEYVRIAAELAADPARLATIRSTLRPRLLASVLCDERLYCERLGRALRAAWRRRCAAAPGG